MSIESVLRSRTTTNLVNFEHFTLQCKPKATESNDPAVGLLFVRSLSDQKKSVGFLRQLLKLVLVIPIFIQALSVGFRQLKAPLSQFFGQIGCKFDHQVKLIPIVPEKGLEILFERHVVGEYS